MREREGLTTPVDSVCTKRPSAVCSRFVVALQATPAARFTRSLLGKRSPVSCFSCPFQLGHPPCELALRALSSLFSRASRMADCSGALRAVRVCGAHIDDMQQSTYLTGRGTGTSPTLPELAER